MRSVARLAIGAAAVGAGIATGYLAERAWLRSRLEPSAAPGPPLGSIAGEVDEIEGPGGIRLTVESYGPPDAPQVVLSHGWVCTGRVWHEQVAGLADRLRLVTYDQPGHGRSGGPRSHEYSLDLFGDALLAVVEHATRPGPLVLCGHSLGGMTVLNAVRRHPERLGARVAEVVLLSTASRIAVDGEAGLGIHSLARFDRPVDRLLTATRPIARYVTDRFYRASSDLSFVLTREFALTRSTDPRYVDFTEQLLLDSDLDMITGVLAPVLTLDEDESLTCLTVPTTIVCGEEDRLTPIALSRRMADRCASAELRALPGIGHMTPLEAHPVVNALLARAAGVDAAAA